LEEEEDAKAEVEANGAYVEGVITVRAEISIG
jgi:hypothetical protein